MTAARSAILSGATSRSRYKGVMAPSEHLVTHDLTVASGERATFEHNVFVNGWLTVRGGGVLECAGSIQSLGTLLENDAAIRCTGLTTNVLVVDRDSGKVPSIFATQITARVVHHENQTLRDLIDRYVVRAEYIQHFAGDSSDYVRGTNPLAPDFFEERGDNDPVVLEIESIREALAAGKRIFKRMEPLVALRSRTAVAAALREPLVEELIAWLASHPGPQRATLEAVESEWLPRLASLSAAAKEDAVNAVRKAIKSPKLAEGIEALRGRLIG